MVISLRTYMKYLQRIINPMEMTRALVRGDVGRQEAIVYAVLLLVLIVVSTWIVLCASINKIPLMTFTFHGGEIMMNLVSLISLVWGVVVPVYLAWEKMSRRTFMKYFVSLNVPISLLAFFITIVIEVPYAVTNNSFEAPISPSHFFFISVVILLQSAAMAYFIAKAIQMRSTKAN